MPTTTTSWAPWNPATAGSLGYECREQEVIQTLPGGVGDLLDDLAQQVSDSVMPALRGISRRIEGSDDKVDRRARTEISKALKQLDQLRDLAGALRRLDTRRIGEES